MTLSWIFIAYILTKRQWFYGFQLQIRIGKPEQLWKLLSNIRNLWEFWNSYNLLINYTQKILHWRNMSKCVVKHWKIRKFQNSTCLCNMNFSRSGCTLYYCFWLQDHKANSYMTHSADHYVDSMFFRDEFKFDWIFTEQDQISPVKDTSSICNLWFLNM